MIGKENKIRLAVLLFQEENNMQPMIAVTHSQFKRRNSGKSSAPIVRDVVVTLTFKVAALVGLTLTVAGTEQTLPVGAPVQVNDAVPANPWPPIESA